MVLYYKNNYTVFPKAKSYDGSVDIIFISNATKFAFVIGDAALVDDNEVYREFDMNFPANAPYGEYTYVIAPHTQFSDKWVLKNEILDSLYEDTVLRDVMLETGLLIFVDEEVKTQPEYRERDKKQNESNFIYRKRKEIEEKEPIVPPTPAWYTYSLVYKSPENASVRFYTDASMTVEITDLEKTPYSSVYVVGEADGYISLGIVWDGILYDTSYVAIVLESASPEPEPETTYVYSVSVESEGAASDVHFYTDETMSKEVEDLTHTPSVYIYVTADGYEPQGQMVNGIPNGQVYVVFKMKKIVPPAPTPKYSYAVGSVVPETAVVKWYKNSYMVDEVTELIEIDDSSLYVYAKAEGYKPQGKTVNGRLDDIMIVDFVLDMIQPQPEGYTITYTTIDDKIAPFTNLENKWGNGVKVLSNTYADGVGTIVFNNPPTKVPSVGFGASNLKTINLPNSIVEIGDIAFQYATNLESLTLPASVTKLGMNCFQMLTSKLRHIYFTGQTAPSIWENPKTNNYGIVGVGWSDWYSLLTVHYPAGSEESYSLMTSTQKYCFGYFGIKCVADL